MALGLNHFTLIGDKKSMALPTWGMLAKNQDDPEKIEEAINRLIAAHNEDESAHLGSGQSLQSHKASEIIDHAVRSIVADKFTDKQVIVQTTFESIDGWNYDGLAPQLDWPGVLIHCGDVLNAETYLWTESSLLDVEWVNSDLLFQATLRFSSYNNELMRAAAGDLIAGNDGGGIGFESVNGTLYGVFRNWGNRYTVELQPTPTYEYFTVRAEVKNADNKIYYYVNGILKGTLDLEPITQGLNPWPTFSIKNAVAGVDAILYITHVMVARNI